uniref:Plectin/eS10 N-terminal domain-containing protein n=2 Tax=Capra hircus TaxID=9925 RepID=A0A8C2RJP3_CAPHI
MLVTGEMSTKTTVRYHLSPFRPMILRAQEPKLARLWRKGASHAVGRNANESANVENGREVLEMLKTEFSDDPAIRLAGIHPAPAQDTATVAMLMPKKNRIGIYELLFKEGVMVTKKDVHVPKHPELADKTVPDLHAMEAGQSPRARGYVKEQSAWRHFCWNLTSEGVQHLRGYLHLPPEIVPATLRRSHPETGRPRPKGLGGRATRKTHMRRSQQRHLQTAPCPLVPAEAGLATEFQFRGGFGRGRGQPPQ